MRTQKALAIAPLFLLICVCIVVALVAYRLHTAFSDEEDFFTENRAMFRSIVTLAETAKVRDWGCHELLLPTRFQSKVGHEIFETCYSSVGEVTYILVRNPFRGELFCYIAHANGLPRGFGIGNGLGGRAVHRFDDGWFLCSLSYG